MKTQRQLVATALQRGLKPLPKLTVSDWADKYRKLPSDSAEPGQWKTSRTPYTKDIMDSFTQPNIHRIAVKSAAQIGKALSIDTPIATVGGWKVMADIEVGDAVFDECGDVCKVVASTDIMHDRPCYEITFSSGEKIIADALHQWQVFQNGLQTVYRDEGGRMDNGAWQILTTEQLSQMPLRDFYIQRYFYQGLSCALRRIIENSRVFDVISKVYPEKRSGTYRLEITAIKKVGSVPVKCIQVDSPSRMYLCGRGLIPTHNSEILNNVIGRMAHLDPCSILMIQPTLELAQDFSKSRIAKMIQDTKILTPIFYDNDKTRNTNQTILSKFFVGGRLVLAGANSPAGLASRPIRVLLCDEVDRYPASAGGNSGGEGDPVLLASKRTTTFWNYKIGLFSTPTNEGASRIDVEYLSGTQEEWQHQCPNCKEYHILDHRQMNCDYKETEDEYHNKTVIVKKVVWRCPDCGFEYDELTMKRAAQKYVARNPEALANGIRSFWLNGFSSPWLTWQEIMTEWYEARGKPEMEAVIFNTRFGLSYRQAGEFADENVFLKRREKYNAEIPAGVKILTAGVDVQDNRLEYEIVGWSEGDHCYGITKGFILGVPNLITTWQELDAVLDRDYYLADGTSLNVFRTFIDSGGHFTSYVYEYCSRNLSKGRFAIKGQGSDGLKLIHKITRASNAACVLVMLGVNAGKQQIMNRLAIDNPAQDYYFHYPQEDEHLTRGYDAVYFKGLISERRRVSLNNGILRVIWENVDRTTRNEPLDLRVYALAAYESCRVNWKKPHQEQAPVKSVKPKLASSSMNLWS